MEEEPINMNVDMEAPLEEELSRENAKKKTQLKTKKMKLQPPEMDGEALSGHVDVLNEDPRRIIVSLFEQSVENHFKAMDTIFKLCKGPDDDNFDREEVERLSSSVTFLREWRHFNYRPRIIRFSCETESSLRKDVIGETTLSQFSSASVPKMDGCEEQPLSLEDDEDFVMHVGGSVWALDWCPRVRQGCQGSQSHFTTEFIAVAAHPPESSYHKIGAPLTGRGLIQIWCLLNASIEDEDSSLQDAKRQKRNPSKGFNAKGKPGELPKKPRGRPRKQIVNESAENLDCKPRKLRGRPRKNPINEQAENSDLDSNPAEALTLQFPKDSGETKEKPNQKKKPRGRPRNTATNNEVKISLKLHGVSGKSDEHAAKGDMASKHNESICMPPASAHCVQALAVQFSEDLCNPKEKSSQTKKPRGRARQKPVNESVDNLDSNSQHDQAHVVRFPSTRGGSGDNTEHTASGNSIKQNDCQMPMASTHCIQALPVQFPEESHNTKEKSSKRKKSSGSAGKKPINESNDCQMPMASTHCIQVLPVQFTEDSPNTKEKSSKRKKSRGRAGKKPINVSTENVNCSSQYDQALAVRFTDNSSKLQCKAGVSGNSNEPEVSNDYSMPTALAHPRLKDKARRRGHNSGKGSPLLAQKEIEEASTPKSQMPSSCRQDIVASIEHFDDNGSMETNPNKETIPEDVALPRVVLCLAHNGKVTWDVKWRPCNACDAESKQRMGYLAVLLGNGALEVWEIPLPHAIRRIYPNFQKEDTDPRFMKLNPVFRCSMLKCGDRQSIPLTMEWSGSPHDFILAGCHDGVVALWKFSVNDSCKDTRPLLCFTADSAPIRGVAWAPVESDTEGKNVIVTAGHKGLKFWDLRDPFRPLWDLNPVQRIIYSLDWLPDPRCVIVSFDDGTMRILSLVKAAYDVPVTGRPFVGTQQQGFNSYYCSPFTIWSVHVSRLTGMVAYCGADGTVLRFQLTTRSVEKDPLRNRAPHFLCGSLVEEEESVLMVITPLPDVPHPMKKSLNEWGDTPRTIRGFLSVSNQAKRAIEQMAKTQSSYDHQTPALCSDDEPGTEIEPADDEKITAQKGKKAQKSKASSKKHAGKNKALVCIEEGEEEDINKGEIENEIESFPPKIVAMHKVRWNMNKGSQRWLCYGGAAGILRCQKIKL